MDENSHVFIYGFLILGIIFFVYGNTLHFDFVWDDTGAIVYNPNIRNFSCAFHTFFSSSHKTFNRYNPAHLTKSNYRPLRTLLHSVIYKVKGLTPSYYHFINILFHAITAFMFFIIVRRFFKNIYAFACSLIFALHPVATEVVCWAKCVEDSLAAFFLLLSLNTLFYIKSLSCFTILKPEFPEQPCTGCSNVKDRGNQSISSANIRQDENNISDFILLILSGSFFLLALFSKLSVAFFPIFIVLFVSYLFYRLKAEKKDFNFSKINRGVYIIAGLFSVEVILILMLRKLTVGKIAQGHYIAGSFGKTLLSMPGVFLHYIQLFLYPFNLCADYETFPMAESLTDIKAWIFTLIFLLIFIWISCAIFKIKKAFAGWIWMWTALLPFSNIIPMVQLGADRFLYIPSMGYALLITECICTLKNRLKLREIIPLWGIFFIILGYGIMTYNRSKVWENEITLWESMKDTMPQGNRATRNLVKAYLARGKVREALFYARQLVSIHPDPENIALLGLLFCMTGREQNGLRLLIQTEDHVVLNIVGAIAVKQKKYSFAKICFEYAHKFAPHIKKYIINLERVERTIKNKNR